MWRGLAPTRKGPQRGVKGLTFLGSAVARELLVLGSMRFICLSTVALFLVVGMAHAQPAGRARAAKSNKISRGEALKLRVQPTKITKHRDGSLLVEKLGVVKSKENGKTVHRKVLVESKKQTAGGTQIRTKHSSVIVMDKSGSENVYKATTKIVTRRSGKTKTVYTIRGDGQTWRYSLSSKENWKPMSALKERLLTLRENPIFNAGVIGILSYAVLAIDPEVAATPKLAAAGAGGMALWGALITPVPVKRVYFSLKSLLPRQLTEPAALAQGKVNPADITR